MKILAYRKFLTSSLLATLGLCSGFALTARAQEAEEGALGMMLDGPPELLSMSTNHGSIVVSPGESRPTAEDQILAMGPDGCPGGPGGPGFGPGPGMPPPPGFGGPGMPPHPPGGPGFGPPGGPMMLPLAMVDLTDDQVEKLSSIKNATHEKAAPIGLKLHSLEREYRSVLLQADLNGDNISRLQSQIAEQKQALDAIFNDSLVASARVLTAEQRNQIRQKEMRHELGPIHVKVSPSAGKS